MVESMSDIRNCKKMAGIMLAVILLTFFGVIQEKLPVNTVVEMFGAEQSITDAAEDEIASACKMPDRETRITASKTTLDEVVTREQKTVHVMPIRFIAVVCALFCAIRVVYRITIRRFGCRMIALWENILYIHQIDGAKGNDLLYT